MKLNVKNLLEAKKFAQKLLRDELSDRHINSINVGSDCAYLRSDKAFCLVKFLKRIENDFDVIFPDSLAKIGWKKYVTLEKNIFDQYLKKLELLKKECPVKGSVIFIVQTGEIYLISPIALRDLVDDYEFKIEKDGKTILCFLTLFLNAPQGIVRSKEELLAQKKASIIYQINSLGSPDFDDDEFEEDETDEMESDFYNYLFSDKNNKIGILDRNPKYSEINDDDVGQLSINLLYEISKNIKSLSKDLKSIKKLLSEK